MALEFGDRPAPHGVYIPPIGAPIAVNSMTQAHTSTQACASGFMVEGGANTGCIVSPVAVSSTDRVRSLRRDALNRTESLHERGQPVSILARAVASGTSSLLFSGRDVLGAARTLRDSVPALVVEGLDVYRLEFAGAGSDQKSNQNEILKAPVRVDAAAAKADGREARVAGELHRSIPLIAGTSLDRGLQLALLDALPPAGSHALLLGQAKAGRKVSAKPPAEREAKRKGKNEKDFGI